tara:strand:+ start:135 stop:1139 length:1005 start_codon:yes stop_codon:yes gene_type:complete
MNLTRKLIINESSFKTEYKSLDGSSARIYEKSNLLGYKNIPNARIKATKKSYSKKKISYFSIYTTNSTGNRRTTKINSKKNEYALFLGGSFTFGTGINDDQTLPSLFQEISQIKSINAGVGGYGIHQAYTILKDSDLYSYKSEGKDISVVIYRMLVNHINRAAGYASWDTEGPCYKLNQKNQVVLIGSFKKCGSKNNYLVPIDYFIRREPATSNMLRNIRTKNYTHEIYYSSDIQLAEIMLTEMRDIVESRGAQFIVILEDFTRKTIKYPCSIDPHSEAVREILLQKGIKTIFTSSFLSVDKCKKGIYDVKHDGHPSEERNRETALAIWEFLNK